MSKLIILALTFISVRGANANDLAHISCFSDSASIVIVLVDDNCVDNGRGIACKARVEINKKVIKAFDRLFVLQAQLPQTRNQSLMLTNQNMKSKLMLGFSGMSTTEAPKKFTGEFHAEFKDVNLTEKMDCTDYSKDFRP